MYQIDNSTAAATIPASTSAGAPGFFTDGNPATGVPATIMPAEFMNMLMMEVMNVLAAAGVTPSKSNFTQLATAIRGVNRQAVIIADTGTAGAYAAANSPALTALPATGYAQWVNIAHPNPGASTYAPDGLAAKPIYGLGLQPLQGGELPVGVVCFRYLVQPGVNSGNGAWIIIESLGGPSQIAPGTASSHAATVGQLQSGYGSFAVDTGTANTYVCSFTPAITARSESAPLRFKVKTSNNGACTLNDGLGVVPLVGGAHSALQGGEMLANGDAWVQWNASVGGGSYILLFCTGAAEQVALATQSQHAVQFGQVSGVVGQARNVKMSVAAASATATMTADEIVLETALGGLRYCLSSINKTINLATNGAGGMDTGAAPVSGFVAIYAIFNPATGVSALLGKNATAAVQPEVYGGANMPAGYTASALLSVLPTNASSLIVPLIACDRRVDLVGTVSVLTTTGNFNAPLSIAAAVPMNARYCKGYMSITGSTASSSLTLIASSAVAAGQVQLNVGLAASGAFYESFHGLMIGTPQTIAYSSTGSAGATTFATGISGYEI